MATRIIAYPEVLRGYQSRDKNQIEIEREIIYSENRMHQRNSVLIRENAEYTRKFSKKEREYSIYLIQQAQNLLRTATRISMLVKKRREPTPEQILIPCQELNVRSLETVQKLIDISLKKIATSQQLIIKLQDLQTISQRLVAESRKLIAMNLTD